METLKLGQIHFTSDHHTSHDVAVTSGYLYSAMQYLQQEGGNLNVALKESCYLSLVACDHQPDPNDIAAQLKYNGERAIIDSAGSLWWHGGGMWHECIEAPPCPK